MRLPAILALSLLATTQLAGQQPTGGTPDMSESPIVSFDSRDSVAWYAVHDNVMGGLSDGGLERTGEDTGLFSGDLSLENNGGFASVRAVIDRPDLARAQGLEIRVRGDGRTYQLRLRTDDRFDGVAYTTEFATEAEEWTTHRLAFTDFRPTFRGRTPSGVGPIDPSRIRQLGLLLGDKKPGPFALEIDWIRPWHGE